MAKLFDESRAGKQNKNIYKYLIAEIGGVIISINLWLGLIPMYKAKNGFVWIYIGILLTLFLAGLIRPRNVVYVWYRKEIKRKAWCFMLAVTY